jgi:hypothetical protein
MEGVFTAEAVIDNGAFGTHTIKFETGRLARLAAGSAVATLDEETVILSATTAGKHPKEGLDFFPLTVDVEERMYAIGRIPGSFFRREGRPSEDAILTCRPSTGRCGLRSSKVSATKFRSSRRSFRSILSTCTTWSPSTPHPCPPCSPGCRSRARSLACGSP